MSRVLVLNCGSSSVKYRLFDGEDTLAKGLVERIGEGDGDAPDHEAALRQVLSSVDTSGRTASVMRLSLRISGVKRSRMPNSRYVMVTNVWPP